jgi:hypothetical protein
VDGLERAGDCRPFFYFTEKLIKIKKASNDQSPGDRQATVRTFDGGSKNKEKQSEKEG